MTRRYMPPTHRFLPGLGFVGTGVTPTFSAGAPPLVSGNPAPGQAFTAVTAIKAVLGANSVSKSQQPQAVGFFNQFPSAQSITGSGGSGSQTGGSPANPTNGDGSTSIADAKAATVTDLGPSSCPPGQQWVAGPGAGACQPCPPLVVPTGCTQIAPSAASPCGSVDCSALGVSKLPTSNVGTYALWGLFALALGGATWWALKR